MAENTLLLQLNSIDRINPQDSPSKAKFNLPSYIKNRDSFRMICFMMANTYYNITNSNNRFNIGENEFIIPIGSYDLQQFLQQISNIVTPIYQNFSIIYNDITSSIEIQNDTNFQLSFQDSESHRRFGKQLGFINELYSGSNLYAAEHPIKIYDLNLNIRMNIGSSVRTTNRQLNMISWSVANNANKQDIIQFYDKTQYSHFNLFRKKIDAYIEVDLLDNYGNNLVGCSDWMMIIEFC